MTAMELIGDNSLIRQNLVVGFAILALMISFASYVAHLAFCRWFIRHSRNRVCPADAVKLLAAYRPVATAAIVRAVASLIRSLRAR